MAPFLFPTGNRCAVLARGEPRRIYIVGGPFMKRKLLSILLTLCLAFSLLPTAALADGEGTQTNDVAQIGGTGYATLQAAIDAAKSGDTIVLKKSISATEIGEKKQLQFVKADMNVTLDLNQNTITAEAGEAIAINAANITLTVKNGTIENFAEGSYSDGVYAYKESNNLTLTFENIVLKSRTQGLAVQGLTSNSNVNIVNSNITSTEGLGIYYPPKSGTLTISDSEITGVTGIVVKGSNLVVNGEKTIISGTGPNVDPETYYTGATDGSSTLTETGDAVYVESGYNDRDISVSISGGHLNSKNAKAVRMFVKNGENTSAKREISVTGGTFSSDVSAYVAKGYVQNENGTVEQLGETNAVAKVGDTSYYKTLPEAIAAAQDGDTITLLKDAELTSTLNLAKNITIDGQGKYTIKAANSFTVGSDNKTYCVLYVSGEVTLKDVTVNGNEKCRVIFCDKGKLTIDGATITNGKAPNFIGGVYMTSSASFEMKSGSITGNKNAKAYQNDEYLQYSSDLWIGANANGALTAINGGTIGNVFVNANAWSASNPGSFTMNGGTVTNLYVEHDANYGATFKYNDGTIEHLYLSKENGNGQSIEVTPVKGVIYNGGVKEQDLVTLTMKYNDGATADSTYNVASGTTITLPTPRRSGYTFNGWYDGSKFYAAGASYTVSATVTLNASWSYISSGSSYDPTYSVSTPSKTEHGTVTVSPKSASKGDTVTVTVKPDSGYVLETLTVTDKNGNELTLKDKGDGKYTFTMPAGKVEVKATFMEDNSVLNFFYDVPNGAYFYEAVKWAVKSGVTNGLSDTMFGPYESCTRAQIVTFLWRAAGSPEPKAASSFTDVPASAYYAKAVAWAVENGITNGMTETTFAPNATCTRGQSVTFLYRALKGIASGSANFTDVPANAFYTDAINWAVANNVTNGTSNTTFGPYESCTRAQIVTFLYRAYQGK